MSRDDELSALVLDVLRHVAPEMDDAGIDPGKTFHDQLGIDSIDFLNLVMGLEDRLGMRIGELDYPKLSSLGGCIAYFGSRMHATAIVAAVPLELRESKA